MDNSYGGWLKQAAFDDTYGMQSSNDTHVDSKVGLDTLGVVDLDVFGLRAFDFREPVVWVLPGDFSNMVRVLVPDATATLVGFHDVMIENISSTPDYRTRMVSTRDITSLRRCWPSSLFMDMHRRQAEMETLRRACKREFDSEFGGGRAGTCPHCGTHVFSNMSHLLWLRSTRTSSHFQLRCSPGNATCSPENFTCSPENFTCSLGNCI